MKAGRVQEICDQCGGAKTVLCSLCNGSGEGMFDGSVCFVCKGQGEVECNNCDGLGVTFPEEEDA